MSVKRLQALVELRVAIETLTDDFRQHDAEIRAIDLLHHTGLISRRAASCLKHMPLVFMGESLYTDFAEEYYKPIAKLDQQIQEYAERAGIDPEGHPRTFPPEYQALNALWERETEKIIASVMEAYGEPEMAAAFLENREMCDQEYRIERICQIISRGPASPCRAAVG